MSSTYQGIKIKEKKVLGKGAFGEAVLCETRAGGDQFVKKKIKCQNHREVQEAKREAKMLQDLKCTNIIGVKDDKFKGGLDQKGAREVNIFMEYADGGDLAGEIEKRQRARKPYTEGELINRFADCVKAVNNMHKKGVVHRDIKPANIFLNKDGPAKLGDLGIAEQCSKNGRCSTPIGTPLYLDPQRINNKSYGQKADVWSLGCVLYEMAALQPAFNARSMADLKSKINRGQVDLSKLPKEYSPEVGQMIKEMLQLGEPKRASVESIMSNPLVDKELRRRSSSVAPAKAAPTVPKHMEAEDQGARGRSSSLPAHLRDGARGGARPRSVSPVARRESVADAAAAVKAANAAPRARGRSPTAHPIGPREAHRRSVSPLVQAAEVKAAVGAARERGRSISPVPPSSSRPGGAALRRRSSSPVVVGRGRIGSENGPSPLARVSEAPTAVKIPSKLGAREIREATPENLAPAQSMLGVANGVNRAMFPSDAARGKAVVQRALPPIAAPVKALVTGHAVAADPWRR